MRENCGTPAKLQTYTYLAQDKVIKLQVVVTDNELAERSKLL